MEKELLFFSYDVFGIPFVDPVSGTAPRLVAAGGTCLQEKGMCGIRGRSSSSY